jgi:hypothetical protein
VSSQRAAHILSHTHAHTHAHTRLLKCKAAASTYSASDEENADRPLLNISGLCATVDAATCLCTTSAIPSTPARFPTPCTRQLCSVPHAERAAGKTASPFQLTLPHVAHQLTVVTFERVLTGVVPS